MISFVVPMFDKEDVIVFVANIEKYIGSYEIIYNLRNVEGRHILLRCSSERIGNKQDRTFSKKKVTSVISHSNLARSGLNYVFAVKSLLHFNH